MFIKKAYTGSFGFYVAFESTPPKTHSKFIYLFIFESSYVVTESTNWG